MIIREGGYMSSRMDRYYDKHPEDMKRTSKNSNLYEQLYADKDYTIESASLDVGKEIDISNIKELLNKRSSYNELRDYRIIKPEEEKTVVSHVADTDTNSHDINEMLDKAKEEKPEEDKKRSLEETQLLTLQELISQKSYANKTSINKEEVKDLLDTLYDTKLLSGDGCDDLLDGLKSTGNTIVTPSIKQILDDARKSMEKEMDNSFFTSSLGFKKDELKEDEEEIDESDAATTKFLIVLGLIFVAIVIFIIVRFVIL